MKTKSNKGIEAYVSELVYSKLLNTLITTICTHYHNTDFESTDYKDEKNPGQKHHVVACIDVDMSKFLKIKKANTNILNYDSQLPQLDRSTFMVLDGLKKAIRYAKSWKLPFEYISPWTPYLIPVTGILNKKDLDGVISTPDRAENNKEVVSDSNNPSVSTKVKIIGEEREVGIFQFKNINGQSKMISSKNYHYSLFYFNVEKEQGQKTKLIQEKVKNSKWQITLLTLICVIMISGIVMCISCK